LLPHLENGSAKFVTLHLKQLAMGNYQQPTVQCERMKVSKFATKRIGVAHLPCAGQDFRRVTPDAQQVPAIQQVNTDFKVLSKHIFQRAFFFGGSHAVSGDSLGGKTFATITCKNKWKTFGKHLTTWGPDFHVRLGS